MNDSDPRCADQESVALAVDLGARRVGLAITRAGIAMPLVTLTRERKPSDRIRRLIRLANQEGATLFVVGLPLQLDGNVGAAAVAARAFAERLATQSARPVVLVDERLTSVEAEEAMKAAGATWAARRARLDQVAAVLMLQAWQQGAGERIGPTPGPERGVVGEGLPNAAGEGDA